MPLDLFLTHRSIQETRIEPYYSNERWVSDRMTVDLGIDRSDLRLVDDREALAQSVLNRLFTRVGELEGLGHPDYGSRLHLVAGEPNTNRTRALAALYIRESLANEELIEEVVSVEFEPVSRRLEFRHLLEGRVVVRQADGSVVAVPLTLNTDEEAQ